VEQLPNSITLVLALLTVFLIFAVGIKYAIQNNFTRTRLVMTSFFCFIVLTLTISFWAYRMSSLPYTIPAALAGILAGYLLGVRTEQQKLRANGIEHYMEHFAHVHVHDFKALNWWSVINFYSVMGGLLLINLVGLSIVIFGGDSQSAIRTSMVGAFLLGTIVPYLVHLWSIKAPHQIRSTTKEA
jgi:ACR3 family arsenite efflux pump ArsB